MRFYFYSYFSTRFEPGRSLPWTIKNAIQAVPGTFSLQKAWDWSGYCVVISYQEIAEETFLQFAKEMDIHINPDTRAVEPGVWKDIK